MAPASIQNFKLDHDSLYTNPGTTVEDIDSGNSSSLHSPSNPGRANADRATPQAQPIHLAPLSGSTSPASIDSGVGPAPHADALFSSNFDFDHHIAGFSAEAINNHSKRIQQLWPDISESASKKFPEFAALYSAIKNKNLPNFLGAKITLNSDLILENWESMLKDYHDKDICQFLRYFWPVGYEADVTPSSVQDNHKSANTYPSHVRAFIDTELHHNAVIGPFNEPPFTPWTRVSPILTRPKKDSPDRRIIIDLSFPKGDAVNNGININAIFGRDSAYTLPTISDLTSIIKRLGRGAWMWKADLS